jgi:hypothetical protein
MSRRSYLSVVLALAVFCHVTARPSAAQVDHCKSTVAYTPGVVLICPQGDGDPLTNAAGGTNCQITLTVRDASGTPITGIPASDMWLTGCNNGLLLCGNNAINSKADGATNASGVATFSNEPVGSGCDSGVFVMIQGISVKSPGTCSPLCVSVAVRGTDYKSAGGPVAPCGGDLLCPDGKVSNSDFSWFATHYPTATLPNQPYHACVDYTAPLAQVTLSDYSAFVIHFAGAGHSCP